MLFRSWSTVTNGDLIRLAEQRGFELLITTDRNLLYQQNLMPRSIAILVLSTTSWPRIRQAAEHIATVIATIGASGVQELKIP